MRRGNVVWIAMGAWLCTLTWVLRWAMPEGYYFDGREHPWAPAWIPLVLGLSIFSIGLIPYLTVKLSSRRKSETLDSSVDGSQTLPIRPKHSEEELSNRRP